MPRMDAPDATYPTMKHNFKWARITKLYPSEDTADIEIVDKDRQPTGEIYNQVPIFFHCKPTSELKPNGALDGAASAFEENDIVIVRFEEGNPLIVGLKDGKRECVTDEILIWIPSDLEPVSLTYYGGYRYNSIDLYRIRVDKEGGLSDPSFVRSLEALYHYPCESLFSSSFKRCLDFNYAKKVKNPYPSDFPIAVLTWSDYSPPSPQNYTVLQRSRYNLDYNPINYCFGGEVGGVRYYIVNFGVGMLTDFIRVSHFRWWSEEMGDWILEDEYLFWFPVCDYWMWVSGYGWFPLKCAYLVGGIDIFPQTGEVFDPPNTYKLVEERLHVYYDTFIDYEEDTGELTFWFVRGLYYTDPSGTIYTRNWAYAKKKFRVEKEQGEWVLEEDLWDFSWTPGKPDWFEPDPCYSGEKRYSSFLNPLEGERVRKFQTQVWNDGRCSCIWCDPGILCPSSFDFVWSEGEPLSEIHRETYPGNPVCNCYSIGENCLKLVAECKIFSDTESEPNQRWDQGWVWQGEPPYCITPFPDFVTRAKKYRKEAEHYVTIDHDPPPGQSECMDWDYCNISGNEYYDSSSSEFLEEWIVLFLSENLNGLFRLKDFLVEKRRFVSLIGFNKWNFVIFRWGGDSFLSCEHTMKLNSDLSEVHDIASEMVSKLRKIPNYLNISWIT